MSAEMYLHSKISEICGVHAQSPMRKVNLPIYPDVQQSYIEIVVRRLLSKPLSLMPEAAFLGITGLLKFILQKGEKKPSSAEYWFEGMVNDEFFFDKGLWDCHPLPLVLTHDVDLNSCYKNVDKVASIEKGLGIASTWHLLTDGRYKLERCVLDELVRSGHEIGLHGTWHDIAFGFRPTSDQMKMIEKGLCALAEYSPISFRAPGLAWTPALSKILADRGIRADSSLSNYNGGRGIFRPIPMADGKLWELPLTLQDDYLFKNLRLGEKDACILITKVLNENEQRKIPAILNFHPSIMAGRLGWYEDMLGKIVESKKWMIMRISDIVNQFDEAWQLGRNDE